MAKLVQKIGQKSLKNYEKRAHNVILGQKQEPMQERSMGPSAPVDTKKLVRFLRKILALGKNFEIWRNFELMAPVKNWKISRCFENVLTGLTEVCGH